MQWLKSILGAVLPSYSTRVHLMRRVRGVDYTFLGAAIGLGVIILLAIRYS